MGFKFTSIRRKLIFLMVLVSVSVISIASLLLYQNEIEILENSVIENSRTQAAIVGSSLASAIIFDDDVSARSTLSLLAKNEQVQYAFVALPDGRVFAEYSKEAHLNGNQAIHLDKESLLRHQYVFLGKEALEITEAIVDQEITIGYLYIQTSLDKLVQQQTYYRKILSYVVLFSLFFTVLLSTYAQRFITQPLNVMVRYVRELSHTQDYKKRMPLVLHDELGTLISGFNHMLDVVEERERALKEQSANLQTIVDERTEQLYQKAHFDSLTLLPNRYLLSDRLEHAIFAAKRKNERLAILFMDLDRFKIINDSLGHDVGDELLKAAASRLKSIGRDLDTVARLGGDEFIYLAEGVDKPESAARIAEKINQAFSEPFVLAKHVLHVSTSIGISMYPADGEDITQLLKNADVSMYYSKGQGPGNYCFYRSDMNDAMHQKLNIENSLRNAISNNELHLVYQPQVCVDTKQITKVEALLRWTNPDLGVVAPSEFIPIAEEIGIINQLGRWVITQACKQQQQWRTRSVRVAVNVSSSQLLDVGLVNFVKNVAKEYDTQLTDLEFEITEDVFLEHSANTIEVLTELQGLGVKIAIDDFGTGYSSLSYLKDLPVDTLKLDGMFVMDLEENRSSRGIVSSTIILAHSLNMKIVAECVENEAQYEYLKSQNCDFVQGYHLYKPLMPEELLKVI